VQSLGIRAPAPESAPAGRVGRETVDETSLNLFPAMSPYLDSSMPLTTSYLTQLFGVLLARLSSPLHRTVAGPQH